MATHTPESAAAARKLCKRMNEHHQKTCAGFYGDGPMGGRYFGARTSGGRLQVTPDFGVTWIDVPAGQKWRDHNAFGIFK